MQSFLHKGIQPSAPLADSIAYLNTIGHLQSITADCGPFVDKIKELLASPKNRLFGLMLLKTALEQNSDVYVKGAWCKLIPEILNDPVPPILKEYSCEIFCMLLPQIKKEAASLPADIKKILKEMIPFLLGQIDDGVEWSKAAWKCVRTYLTLFPQALLSHKEDVLKCILEQVSYSVSSEVTEIIAECFAELPNVSRGHSNEIYNNEWKDQYVTTLNTLHGLLNDFMRNDPVNMTMERKESVYVFTPDDESCDPTQVYMKTARRFINLTKCMAKMLSTQTGVPVSIPIKRTVIFISRLFQVRDFQKVKPTTIELQIFYSFLSQMQLATLAVLESLLLNLDVLVYSSTIVDLIWQALESSTLESIAFDSISEIRLAAWRILKIFLKKYGSNVSGDVIKHQHVIIPALFADIITEEKKREALANQTSLKLKKAAANLAKRKYREINHQVCEEALEVLEQLIYTGYIYFLKEDLKDIFAKILNITCTLRASLPDNYPPPYNNELCRKNLYSVLLSLALTSNIHQKEFAHATIQILKNAFRDSSPEVTGFCNLAVAALNAKIHPERPPLKCKPVGDKSRSKVSVAVVRCSEWTSDAFIPDLPLENTPPKVHENSRLPQTFRNERAVHQEEEVMEEEVGTVEDVLEAEPHYSENYASECYIAKYHEQGTESHHNGDDILEIRQSNQCQDEESDEDEEEEEEEEEDDDDRSYGEEETNQEDITPENIYIPSTSKLQGVTPVHISPETLAQSVSDQEYEQLRPCVKAETSSVESNKNMHLNGMHSIVPGADVPSSSTQPSLANENGCYPYDEEEDMEMEEEEENDDENETVSFPAEKRLPTCYSPNVQAKRQKLENNEPKLAIQDDEDSEFPNLDDMKADFSCLEETNDNVKS